MAKFLGLEVDDVFPISYDLRPYSKGLDQALVGVVRKEPREKLELDDLMALAVPLSID